MLRAEFRVPSGPAADTRPVDVRNHILPVLQLDFTGYGGWRLHCPACGHPVLEEGAGRAGCCDHLLLHYDAASGLNYLSPRLPDPARLSARALLQLFRSSPSRLLFRLRVDGTSDHGRSHWVGFELRDVLLTDGSVAGNGGSGAQ